MITYLIRYKINGLNYAKATKTLTKDLNAIKKQNATDIKIKIIKA